MVTPPPPPPPLKRVNHHVCAFPPAGAVCTSAVFVRSLNPGASPGAGTTNGSAVPAVAAAPCGSKDHAQQRDHHDHDDHGPADAGAYVTLAVDFLHNVIDGIGCVCAGGFKRT